MSKTKKLQKPIDYDIHLKYRCNKCGIDHWLSYKETSTKNFKVVCVCGLVFKVRQTSGFKLKFIDQVVPLPKPIKENISTVENTSHTVEVKETTEPVVREIPKPLTIPADILEKSVKLLLSYGFTKVEATKLVTTTYMSVPVDDYATLVKYTLQSLGDITNDINSSATL